MKKFTLQKLHKRLIFVGISALVLGVFACAILYAHYFGPVDMYGGQVNFVVQPGETEEQIADELKAQGFIRSRFIFGLAFAEAGHGATLVPGGYNLSASMDIWSIANALFQPPAMIFFSFPPGWRKEQIADKLAVALNWTPKQKAEWINVDTDSSPSFVEGVYYPDTYLIPSGATPTDVANMFIARFQTEFAPYADEAQQEGLPWTEVVILASILEREAAGAQDMPLIAGIMLNRLHNGMPLQIDATLQYIVGTEGDWWPVPTSADKFLNSPFNTYEHVGLPPHAISEPGLGAIKDVLNPEKTSCLFYLHDPNGNIHCSVNYSGQVKNVDKYLK
jgi:UPF0755 protein